MHSTGELSGLLLALLLLRAFASGCTALTGVEAIAKFKATGEKPAVTAGLDFFDTGVQLVTDKPVDGVESIDVAAGEEVCWGK